MVTPCVGVWIETKGKNIMLTREIVTPCVGVWIETCIYNNQYCKRKVTPCVGVWIETIRSRFHSISNWSHPAWVCGLKLI